MHITDIANNLCTDLFHSVGTRNDRSFIVSSFRYPDGNPVAVYAEFSGSDVTFTDKGETLFRCVVNGLSISDSRKVLFENICRRYDVVLQERELRKLVTSHSIGLDFLRFCEAITRVSNIQFEADTHDTSTFPAQVAAVINERVAPRRQVAMKWHHPFLDPAGDYPVDYHINGIGAPRNVFAVGSSGKSTLVSAISSFFRLNDAFVPTLAIVDPNLRLGTHHLNRLQRAATEIRFGVTGYEDDIAKFALITE